jgi:hypothetical protein
VALFDLKNYHAVINEEKYAITMKNTWKTNQLKMDVAKNAIKRENVEIIDEPCPDGPWDAEIKIYCECKYRYVIGICNIFDDCDEADEERKVECNAEWKKNKRDSQIAKAFKKKDYSKIKELKVDFYPEKLIEFAKENSKLVIKIENILDDIIRKKEDSSLPSLDHSSKYYIGIYIKEHYGWEWCTYGGGSKGKTVTDIYYKEGKSHIPSTLLSDYVRMIKKGIISSDADERKDKLFESTLKVYELPVGANLDDIKRHLIGFHSEFYTEKIPKKEGYYLHFYNMYRAEEAYKKLRNCGGGYSFVDLVHHVDIEGTSIKLGRSTKTKKKKKKKKEVDEEGFSMV